MMLAEQLTSEERPRLIQALQAQAEETEAEEDTRLINETLTPYMREDAFDFDVLEAASLSGTKLNQAMPGFIDEMGELRPEADWHDKY